MRRPTAAFSALVLHRTLCATSAALAMLAPGHESLAQGRSSEKGLVAQTVGNTTITIEYYRPVARGRTPVMRAADGQWWTQAGTRVR